MSVNYITLAIPGFFVLIAVEMLAARRLGLEVYRFNDAITDLSCGIGQQVLSVFLRGLLLALYVWVYANYALFTFTESSWLPWVVAFLGVDILYYWWHRLSHEVAFMWAVHVVHHQSEDYNLAVALRQAWFSGATGMVFYLPLAVLGIPPLVFATMSAFSTLYQFWIHTRTVGKLGPLEWVLNTASHHRVHHGRNPKYLDRNYAATLIVWDRLFGTYQEEEEEPHYGTIAPYASWNPVWANFDFWAHLVRKARATPRLVDKIRVFVKGPGWLPPGAVATDAHRVADEPPVRFVSATPRGLAVYVLVQFVPATLATVWLMAAGAATLAPHMAVVAALVLATSIAWGALFERRSWALALELGRLGLVALVAVAGAWAEAIPAGAAAGAGVFVAASAIWALRLRGEVVAAREQAAAA